MNIPSKPHHFLVPFLPLVAALSAAVFWLMTYYSKSYNFNVSWHTECARRLFAGGTMASDCAETNPPMATMTYMPFALIEQATAIPGHIIFPLYALFFVLIATYALVRIAKYIPELSGNTAYVLGALFLLANTVMTGRFFGERDHFVFIGIMVFCLMQYTMTQRLSLPAHLKYASLVLGGIAFLIKPHYVLAAIFMSLLRVKEWRSIRAIFQADFFILGGLGLLYIAVVFIVFNDYITGILPGVLSLYAGSSFQGDHTLPAVKGAILLAICWVTIVNNTDKHTQGILNAFFGLSAVFLIVFVLQKKGFGYHLVPFHGALYCALFLGIYLFIIQSPILDAVKKRAALLGTLCFAILSSFFVFPMPPSLPGHLDYRQNAVAAEIIATDKGDGSCRFMIFGGMREIQSLAYYTKCKLASRHPSMWFYGPVNDYVHAKDANDVSAQTSALKQLKPFADTLAEDFERFAPPITIIPQDHEMLFETLSLSSPYFKTEWEKYSFSKNLPADIPDYFAGTAYYDRFAPKGYELLVRSPE